MNTEHTSRTEIKLDERNGRQFKMVVSSATSSPVEGRKVELYVANFTPVMAAYGGSASVYLNAGQVEELIAALRFHMCSMVQAVDEIKDDE